MCTDYRKLNAVTQGDPYPLPRIEELIDGIGQSKFITILDLTKGYHQVPVKDSDQGKKKAFITPFGKYQFRTMLFGLVTAPTTFQRMMDHVLTDLYPFAKAYLDDILIHSMTWEELLDHIQQVLSKLKEAGSTIKERKCNFAVNQCEYLEHVVGDGKVQPMECKIRSVQLFNQPKTKKQVRSFLGLCGYYRRFMPKFSAIAMPLTELIKKNKPNKVNWTRPCERAFQQLKDMLTDYSILTTPDWKRPFVLQTDASAVGIGYVLSQINGEGEEHPIAFGSRKLLPRVQRYSAIEREALAIVTGIHHYRTYLEETKFRIEIDHNPFTKLTNMRDSHGRLGRWALASQPFDFTVTHKPGTATKNADGLSREWDSLTEEGEMSGTDILTELETLPASGSPKNTAQVCVGWQSPVSEGRGLIDKNRLKNKETAKNKETEENKETKNKELLAGRGLMDKKSLQNKEREEKRKKSELN